jgi:tetratricopeptide (TPR) repeat protein
MWETFARLRLADLYINRGDWNEAEKLIRSAEQLDTEQDDKGLTVALHTAWAEIKHATGLHHAALDHVERAIELAHLLGEATDEGIARRVLGQVFWAVGRRQEAYQALEESLRLIADEDIYEAARSKMHFGLLLLCDGVQDHGSVMVGEARMQFERLGAKRDLVLLACRLQEL